MLFYINMLKLLYIPLTAALFFLAASDETCNDNERWVQCPQTLCIPLTCSQVESSVPCPILGPRGECPGKPACICNDGLVKNDEGDCIPKKQCTPRCSDHEIYEKCPNPCIPQKCSQVGFPIFCPAQSTGNPPSCITKPACICESGYYRNCDGVCVPSQECPSCGGDPNARPGCGNCRKTCANYNSTDPIMCIQICYENACDCLPGYVVDGNTGKCVLPEDCSELTATAAPSTSSCDNVNDQLNDFEDGNIRFTGKFFYEVVKSKPGVSVIMSAFSVLTPLAELALYSSGPSLEELLQVFDLQNKDEIRCVFTQIKNILEAEQNNTLDLGAKVFVNQDFLLTDEFKNDTRDVFDAEAENIDVGDPDKAAAIINDWAAEQTRNRITGVISPESITSYTRLILANAIYFKGTWKTKFDPKDTENKDFSVTKDDTIQVKTMKVKDKFKYAESTDLDAKIIELPYTGDAIRFIGILPNDIEGLTNLLEKLQDPDAFNKALNSLTLETVTVLLPTMDISTTIDLTDILPKTDVTKIFNADTSNLSGIIESNEPLYVSDGTQKANIIVNEEGSEASAVNVVGVSTTSVVLNPPVELFFNVDHPVAYYILYNNIPLFCGTFVKP
ncbi:antichymotrypsin-2-like isoform X3 [Galleria mellonella]|uniref:Antichymotrypsin-2-like isoform X3 n=1 Tax=Galleria mellonella TaxID=7137 RepID=A0A6J3CA32_GALME|nr:antichymotrypsin-2-like isoform X3 [Galleria mellonella]